MDVYRCANPMSPTASITRATPTGATVGYAGFVALGTQFDFTVPHPVKLSYTGWKAALN